MTADQPDDPAVPTTDTADAAATADVDPAEETKRRFREALAAKKGRQGEDHIDGQQAGHAHGRIETKRTFRRKTG